MLCEECGCVSHAAHGHIIEPTKTTCDRCAEVAAARAEERDKIATHLRRVFRCETHPNRDSTTVWGCPDCLFEAKRQIAELERQTRSYALARGLPIR